MAVITPSAKTQFIAANGDPLVGGRLYTYAAGTTTPLPTYTDNTGATPNTNPIILDSRGEANVWLGASTYKFKLCDENGVEIWTVDYISAPTTALSPVLSGNVTISTDSSSPALKITQTGTGAGLVVQDSVDPDLTPFIVNGSGNVGIGTAAPTGALDIADGTFYLTSAGTTRASLDASATTTTLTSSGARAFRIVVNSITSLYINDSGYVGVLNTSPTVAFDVTGAIKTSGAATFGGNTSVTGTLSSTGNITSSTGSVTAETSVTAKTSVITDTISERTAAANVTVNGVPVVYNSGTSYIGGDYLRVSTKTVQSTTSGSLITFSSVPTWAHRITVMFYEVSLSGTDDILVQIGPAAALTTSGYISAGWRQNSGGSANISGSTSGFLIPINNATDTISGSMMIDLLDAATYKYVSTFTVYRNSTGLAFGSGSIALSGLLNQVGITRSGTNTFDGGSVNILYE